MDGDQELQITDIDNKTATIMIPKGIDIDRFLSIHVRKKGNGWFGYVKLEHGNWYHEVDENTKIEYECNRFMNALINAEKGVLRELSPILNEFYELTGREGISRLLRMLLGLQLLFTVEEPSNSNEGIEREIAEGKRNLKLLESIVNKVKSEIWKANDSSINNNWYIALPLIVIIAVAYSQCKFAGQIFWEPFSAGAARNELQAKLPIHKEIKNKVEKLKENNRIIFVESALIYEANFVEMFDFIILISTGSIEYSY